MGPAAQGVLCRRLPLIPCLRFVRAMRQLSGSTESRPSLLRLAPLLALGLAADGLGQLVGYAAGSGGSSRHLTDFEFRRMDFVPESDRHCGARQEPVPDLRSPSLGIILATDRYETIWPVIRHLQRQTIRDQLEIVMVGDASLPGGLDAAELAGFARVHVETVDFLDPISVARAAGVRAARAPLVFIGETHTYAHPTWAEALVLGTSGRQGRPHSRLRQRQPRQPLSWAIFLLDYGQWLYLMPARESAHRTDL